MKAPDKIYVEFSEEVNLAFTKQPFEETPCYIRKKALIKWMQNEIDSIYCGRQYVGVSRDRTIEAETLQKVIDKLNSM